MKRKWMGLSACLLLGVGVAALAASAGKDAIQLQAPLNGANAGAAETSLGDLVADAVRQTGNADIALVAADEITDASIPAGSVPAGQIVKTLRYADDATDTVVVLTLTGAQIRKAIERGLSRAPQPFNGFLQVSGLQVRAGGNGKKIALSVAGAEIADGKSYRVATTRPIADGSLGYFQVWSKTDVTENTGQSVAQSLANYLASHKTLSAAVEGRITTGGEAAILDAVSAQPVPQAPSRPWPGVGALFRAVPYLLLLLTAFLVFSVSTDDPFITFRYALNVLRGFGPVYNVGERVEGFSSPLYVLVSLVLFKFAPGLDILFKAKLLGLGLAALALGQTHRLGRRCGLTASEGVWAQILVASNVNFALAAVNGLETLLYACLILAAAQAFVAECRGRGGDRSAGWLFAALLARPDAILLFVGALFARAVWRRRRGLPWLRLLRWALVFLVPATVLLLARVAYYGELLPNTYYAKDIPIRLGLSDGALYLLRPLSPIGVDLHVFARWGSLPLKAQQVGSFVFWGLFLLGVWRLRRQMSGTLLVALSAALAVFVLRCGGDWMPGLRFLAPVLPLIAVLQCFGLRSLARLGRGRPLRLLIPAGLACALWGVCAWASCVWGVPRTSWAWARYSTQSRDLLAASGPLGRKWVVTADSIHRNFPPHATLAYSEMGFAGLVNPDMTLIDVRGLTDREIARLPRFYKGTWGVDDETWFVPDDPLYAILARRNPDAILAFSHRQAPPFVLGRYSLIAAVRDTADPAWVIGPTLVYLPPSARPYVVP